MRVVTLSFHDAVYPVHADVRLLPGHDHGSGLLQAYFHVDGADADTQDGNLRRNTAVPTRPLARFMR
jgi:hypothetical protein